MFLQKNRLRHDKDVQYTVKHGKSVFHSACGIKFVKNSLEHSRFAVVVGKKVHKSAVKRNRVKRQYREIVRLKIDELKIGYDVVLLTSSKALDLAYDEKESQLLGVFRKAKLL